MTAFTRLFATLLLLCGLALPGLAGPAIPPECLQLVVVTSSDWDATTARMQLFERDSAHAPWRKVKGEGGGATPVNLGRTGMAWGRSALMAEAPPRAGWKRKKEGDGRSPAGLFPILRAFGHPTPPAGYGKDNLPFLVVDEHQCVDDVQSPYYNRILRPSEAERADWSSSETMRIDLYQLGLEIGHNCAPSQAGGGSCIFFHLQGGPQQPTAGCTAMTRAALTQLLLWLKQDKTPLLLQLPAPVYRGLHQPSWPPSP